MGLSEARAAIKRARSQLEKVQVASWDPVDPLVGVTFAFYAYENAVVAVAEARGMKWTKIHGEKAKLARRLFELKILSIDTQDRLVDLNNLRKDVAYGDPGEDLLASDLESLAIDLEQFIDEVEAVVEGTEDEA